MLKCINCKTFLMKGFRLKKLFLLLLLAASGLSVTAQNYTIRGTIRALSSGETLISATVYDMLSGKGALTNAEGRYSLTLPKGKVALRISYVGYKTFFDTIDFYLLLLLFPFFLDRETEA